ncbi:MAG: UDP-N-acetylmuramoyl-L-alanine--D-glutamate ligase, partial [Armatimonadetes bacterium]|nr:UDP-N-acetylmuramoyl-L-alanine--D-glutamate ligase [Armatimonadota bacterium]
MNNYAKKTIAVIGIAHTGLAIAEVMRDRGAQVRIYDKKAAGELADEIAIAKSFGAEVVTGTNSVDLNGVDLLVPSPGVPANLPVFDEARIRNVEIISEIELAFRLSKAPIIAITGTNGKTTTTILTGRMLQESGIETYIAGNVAAGDIRLPLISAVHKAAPQSVIVAEISTFQLEWVHKFQP